MKRFLFLAAMVVAILGYFPADAQVQQACARRADLGKHLEGKFSETPVGMGIADNGGVIEVFAAKDGSTWSVAITMPSGMSCLLATGQFWEPLTPTEPVGPPA